MEWNEIQNSLSNIVFAILIITTISYWINLSFFNKTNFLSNFTKISTLVAGGILFFILLSRWIVEGYFPLSNLYESLLFLTWTLLTLSFYIELKTKSKLIGSILLPIALLINGFANLTLSPEMQKSSPLVPALQSNWLMLHVSMMLLSYATLIIGSLLCILFLVISREKKVNLKYYDESIFYVYKYLINYYRDMYDYFTYNINTYNINLFEKPINLYCNAQIVRAESAISHCKKVKLLQSLDNWSYRIIGLGFPFLTMGIISGGVWANEAWGSYWSWDPKETWALITWLIFATYLHARLTKEWQGTKAAKLGALGFYVIWICYLGVNFLGKGLHSYGWVS